MFDLKEIIFLHQKLYPLMQPQDVVKLLYQNEFGGGHLIVDVGESLLRLEKEKKLLQRQVEDEIVPIGANLARISLHMYQGSLKTLNDIFIKSSQMVVGSKEELISKILYVKETLKSENIFSFSLEDYEEYIDKYISMDCPMVSHSALYKENYNPSYRVIFLELLEE